MTVSPQLLVAAVSTCQTCTTECHHEQHQGHHDRSGRQHGTAPAAQRCEMCALMPAVRFLLSACAWLPAQVARRIFPVGRGLYEDYLSNFWCTTSVAVKWKQLLPNSVLMPACAGITVLVALPSMVQQILHPSPRGLLLGMANSAFAFFMFSYQVSTCVLG